MTMNEERGCILLIGGAANGVVLHDFRLMSPRLGYGIAGETGSHQYEPAEPLESVTTAHGPAKVFRFVEPTFPR